MTAQTELHPQYTAVKSLLFKMQMAGFDLEMVDDSEEITEISGQTNKVERIMAADAITAVDMATVKVWHPTYRKFAYVTVILGNGNGELMADWRTSSNEIETLLEQISEAMEEQYS